MITKNKNWSDILIQQQQSGLTIAEFCKKVIGRKNWLFADTPKGADASAGIYTLIESAKANNLEPFRYLNLIFKELGKASSLEHYERLLPINVKKYFDVATLTTTNN